jgi:peptidoglycan/xylan/chitin deacetylase (PgdA/CDA1 family)
MKALWRVLVALAWTSWAGPAAAVVVLQYHHVSDQTPPSTSISPALFEQHLDALQQQGFDIVPLDRVVALLQEGQPLPDRTAVITFDDGYKSIYQEAFPRLKARGWPFTVFVNTDPHDRRLPLYMSWDELRDLSRHGGTIANHTVAHNSLVKLPGEESAADWAGRVRSQIEQAQRRIDAEIGEGGKVLAYPYGEFDESLERQVAALGYVAFGQHSGPLAPHDSPQALPRFPFGGAYGQAREFIEKILTLPMPLVGARTSGPPRRPRLDLDFPPGAPVPELSCFATGLGAIPVRFGAHTAVVQAPAALDARRFRYNCTAPSKQPGRYYWYSRHWTVVPESSE